MWKTRCSTGLILCAVLSLVGSLSDRVSAQGQGGAGAAAGYPTYAFAHLSTSATIQSIVPMTGPGVLHAICVNDLGVNPNNVTVYDSLTSSGSILARIDTVTAVGCQYYDAQLATGLTVLSSGGTGGDLTITYRPFPAQQ